MKELLSGLIGPVTGIISKVVPDKDEAARLAVEISTMADRHAQGLAFAQIELDRIQAAGTWFQASWRSWRGYVCVLGFGAKSTSLRVANILKVIINCKVTQTFKTLHDSREKLYEGLSHFKTFGRGWTRRNKETLKATIEVL